VLNFIANRLTTVQDIQDYVNLTFGTHSKALQVGTNDSRRGRK